MQVFVAGAGGFIGSELVRQLVASGHDVIGLVRSPAKAEGVRALGATPILGDVRDPAVVQRGVSGADAVAHLALPRAGEGDTREARDIYVRGTRNLLEACREASLRSFVLASGALGVYRHAPGGWIDETAPEDPPTPSVAARVAIDRSVRAAHRESGLPAVILRPPVVYGDGGGFRDFFLDLMRRGMYRVVGDGSYYVNLVRLEDCAAAYRLALERPPVGETLLIVDDEPVTMRVLSDAVAEAMGRRRPGRVPPFLAGLVAGRELIKVLMDSVRLRNAKAKARLGWSPRFPTYREGLAGVVRAYLSAAR